MRETNTVQIPECLFRICPSLNNSADEPVARSHFIFILVRDADIEILNIRRFQKLAFGGLWTNFLRELEFVDAARVAGASNARIAFKHILPNAVGQIIVSVTLIMAGAILLETALSYLGFGVVAPDVSLGSLISEYQTSFTTRPWLLW